MTDLQQSLHKQLYSKFLDELDTDIVRVIMSNPDSEEARLLEAKVEQAIAATAATIVYGS